MDKFSNLTSKIENVRKELQADQETEAGNVLSLISEIKAETQKLEKKSKGVDDRLIEIQSGLGTQLNANNAKIREIEKTILSLGKVEIMIFASSSICFKIKCNCI